MGIHTRHTFDAMRPLGRFVVVYKFRALGPTTLEGPPCVWFDKEEERDEAVRKLEEMVASLSRHAD